MKTKEEYLKNIPLELRNNILFDRLFKDFYDVIIRLHPEVIRENSKIERSFIEENSDESYHIKGDYDSGECIYEIQLTYDKKDNKCFITYFMDLEDFTPYIININSEINNKGLVSVFYQYFCSMISDPKVLEKKCLFDKEGNEISRKTIKEDLKINKVFFEEEYFIVPGNNRFYLAKSTYEGENKYFLFLKDYNFADKLYAKSFEHVSRNMSIADPTNIKERMWIEELTEEEFTNINAGKYSDEELCELFNRNSHIIRVLSIKE